MLTILGLVENGDLDIDLIRKRWNSKSNARRISTRREVAQEILKGASETIPLDDDIETQQQQWSNSGIKPPRCSPFGIRVHAEVEYFCTCDDKLWKKGPSAAEVCETSRCHAAGTRNESRVMSSVFDPLPTSTAEAREILIRDLGIVDTLRFLGQFRTGSGNYTTERGDGSTICP